MTKPELTWEITKHLYPNNISSFRYMKSVFNVSDLKLRNAIQWLVKRKYVVRGEDETHLLTDNGRAFYVARKEILDT